MQNIPNSTKTLADGLAYITLRAYVDGVLLDGDIVKCTYTHSVCGGDSFSIGNACAAEVELVLADVGQVLYGVALKITWDVDGVEYPLFSGVVDSAVTSGGQTTVTAYDAMYLTGALPYKPSASALSSCTAADVLADITAQMGVPLDADTQTEAAAVSLTEGVSNLDSDVTCSAAAGTVAALLGGNAVISRAGELTVRGYSAADFSTRSYSDGAQPEDMDFTLDGLTFRRADSTATTYEDGSQSEETVTTDYIATGSTGGIVVENKLATQALVDGAYSGLSGLTFRPGQFELPGGIEVEPGDLVQVDGLTVAVMMVSLSLDGGCKASITSLGRPKESGAVGAVKQALSALSAELSQTKQLVAENAIITNANIGNLRVTKASAEDLTATNANLQNVTAGVANINNVLAGNVGAGNLQAIHLTGDNAVIDDAIITDAMIANLSVSKLLAGTIYTSLIKIASDADENLLIDGSTLQIRDSNGITRVQIGKDAAGDYNLALWDSANNLLWDASGVYAAGLHDGIIKDIAIADDANISPGKIDMSGVAEKLNEDGSLVVDASHVTIDNTTLLAAYQTLIQADTDLSSRTTTLETNLSVVQGQITAKVWQTDISAVTDPLGSKVNTLEDNYSAVTQTVNGLTSEVASVRSEFEELEVGDRNYALGTSSEWKSICLTGAENEAAIQFYLSDMDSKGMNVGDVLYLDFDVRFGADFYDVGTGTRRSYLVGSKNDGGMWTDLPLSGGNQESALQAMIDQSEVIRTERPLFTNQFAISPDTPSTYYNSSGTAVAIGASSACAVTDYIPFNRGDTLRTSGFSIGTFGGNGYPYCIMFFDANKNWLLSRPMNLLESTDGAERDSNGNLIWTGTLYQVSQNTTLANAAYCKIAAAIKNYATEQYYVTVNEEIAFEPVVTVTPGPGGHIRTAFAVTGDMIDSTYTNKWLIQARFDNYQGTVYWRKQQVKKGPVPTDWTPAPEDVETELSSVKSSIQQTESSILQQVSGTYATKDEVQTVEGKLELSIGTKVGTDELVSRLNASADEINITGDRLVINSTNFELSAEGNLRAQDVVLKGTVYLWDTINEGVVGVEPQMPAMYYNDLEGGVIFPTISYFEHGLSSNRITAEEYHILNQWCEMRLPEIQHGTVSITPSAANTPTGKAVEFELPFGGTPHAFATPGTGVPGTTVTGVGVTGESYTGCTIYLTRTDTVSTGIRWIAAY